LGYLEIYFKDTPTLTSLLFAQKKTKEEIESWDNHWDTIMQEIETKIKTLKIYLSLALKDINETPANIKKEFIQQLEPILNKKDWFLKRGKNSAVEKIDFDMKNLFTVPQVIARCKGY
jgi:type I restriction enzyme M protein